MLYLLTLLFTFITLSIGAEEANISPKKSTAVPHNNGTDGLLKNTLMEPLDNFKRLKVKPATNTTKTIKSTAKANTATESTNVSDIPSKVINDGAKTQNDGTLDATKNLNSAIVTQDELTTIEPAPIIEAIPTVTHKENKQVDDNSAITTTLPVASANSIEAANIVDKKIAPNSEKAVNTIPIIVNTENTPIGGGNVTELPSMVVPSKVVENQTKATPSRQALPSDVTKENAQINMNNTSKPAVKVTSPINDKSLTTNENKPKISDNDIVKPTMDVQSTSLIENHNTSSKPSISANPTSIKQDKLKNSNIELIQPTRDVDPTTINRNKANTIPKEIREVENEITLPVTDKNDQTP
jgi:hypothetical protein